MMDYFEKSRVIRPYKKSALPRLRWTPDLHDHFVEVVRALGGKHKATPKKIMQIMGVKGLKISHIKSHLQMYRSMRENTTTNEFIAVKNYPDKRPHSREDRETTREAPNNHAKVVRVPPMRCQVRRRATEKGTDVISREYQGAAQGSSTSEITTTRGRSIDNRGANLEIRSTAEINFLGLPNHDNPQSTTLNLELTIS